VRSREPTPESGGRCCRGSIALPPYAVGVPRAPGTGMSKATEAPGATGPHSTGELYRRLVLGSGSRLWHCSLMPRRGGPRDSCASSPLSVSAAVSVCGLPAHGAVLPACPLAAGVCPTATGRATAAVWPLAAAPGRLQSPLAPARHSGARAGGLETESCPLALAPRPSRRTPPQAADYSDSVRPKPTRSAPS